MTPAEQAVIAAAERWARAEGRSAVEDAAEALQDRLADLERERDSADVEVPRAWARVVAGDEIYSVKHQRWYRVLATERLDLIKSSPAKVRVTMDGAPPVTVPADATVQVRRSPMGNAVDTWGDLNPEVISS